MYDIAEHIRIFEANPDDDLVTKREAAIKVVVGKLGKKISFEELLNLADDISTAMFDLNVSDSPICEDMIEALKAKSSSFSATDNALQVAVCAALAVLKFISNSAPANGRVTNSVFLSFALWSALANRQPIKDPKLESLRLEVLNEARELTLRSANAARIRASIPALKWPNKGNVKETVDEEDTSAVDFDATAKKTIGSLELNAALDREELDILWWVLGGWSDIAQSRLHTLSELNRAIISGIEISMMLRRVPGNAHQHMTLRGIEEDKEFTMPQALAELGPLKVNLSQSFSSETLIQDNGAVLPLLNAVCFGPDGSALKGQKLNVSSWGARALIEGALLRMVNLPVSPR